MFSQKNNSNTVWIGLSFLVVGLMGGFLFANGSQEGGFASFFGLTENTVDESQQDETPDPKVDVNTLETVVVSTDDDAVLGDADAPVTIVMFSDFQCPYCKNFYQESFGRIKENYIDTGKVKLIYRDFPLSAHKQANLAAQAAECVRAETDDEGYYAFHDWLFENMSSWSGQETAEEIFVAAAEDELGLDIQSCLDQGTYEDEVNADLTAGRSYGVRGTPTFFINGKKLVGAWPYSVFETVIESQL